MPRMSLEVEDADLRELQAQARKAKLTPNQLATRMLKRQLYRVSGPARKRSPLEKLSHAHRATARAGRQLELFDHVRAHGFPSGQLEKRALAEKMGVTERTLYRDLHAISVAVIRKEQGEGAPDLDASERFAPGVVAGAHRWIGDEEGARRLEQRTPAAAAT